MVSLFGLELVHRYQQTDVALVYEVLQRQPLSLVFLRNRHDKAEVGADQSLSCLLVALLGPDCQVILLVMVEKRNPVDLLEVYGQDILLVFHFNRVVEHFP